MNSRLARVWPVATGLAIALGLVACSSGTASQSGSPAASSSATSASASPSSSASTGEVQFPDPNAKVDWGTNGRKAPGMSDGIPNPPGWYNAAFGGPTTDKVLYLTYDDGPGVLETKELLVLLKKYNAKATFFLMGHNAADHIDLVDAEIAGGHAVGNHTWNHPYLTEESAEGVRKQLTDVTDVLGEKRVGPCMRPPFGLIDFKVAKVVKSLGYTPIMWTAHANEWNQAKTPEIIRLLKRGTKPGAVLLMHDGESDHTPTFNAMKVMLPWWISKGYRFEPIAACVKKNPLASR